MVDRKSLRLSATLLFVGVLLSFLAGIFHPERENANNHTAAFAEYASSGNWTAIHLGQFAGMMVIIAGLLVLYFALNVHSGMAGWVARFAAISAVVALALYGVLQAVDGVALKHADAWVNAPDAEKAVRFAGAESIRWLEWGVRSYQSFMLGLSFVLFATVIVWTARIPRPIGYLMGLSGLAYIVLGWVIGSEGFSATGRIPNLLGIILVLGWSIWLLIIAWRMKEAVEAPAG
ncbi:MAG: hypothetical protein OIN86_02425 [Candidatus Methanoperedens sp.]|nr:hypothetical protein [Candidatus Methanoperedens sp.]CAG1003325.1 hypothetical protein METP1_03066 [Methanosarcinales archaeon]